MTEKDSSEQKDDNKKKTKDIAEIFNIDSNSVSFDDETSKDELAILEERKKELAEYRVKLKEIEALPSVDDYTMKMIKEMGTKGMVMLDAIEKEIQDCPRGRDVETAAALISALNTLMATVNNIKVDNAKIKDAQDKLELKKLKMSGEQGKIANQQNIIMVGTANEMLDFLLEKNVIPNNSKIKEIEGIVVETAPKEEPPKEPEIPKGDF